MDFKFKKRGRASPFNKPVRVPELKTWISGFWKEGKRSDELPKLSPKL